MIALVAERAEAKMTDSRLVDILAQAETDAAKARAYLKSRTVRLGDLEQEPKLASIILGSAQKQSAGLAMAAVESLCLLTEMII